MSTCYQFLLQMFRNFPATSLAFPCPTLPCQPPSPHPVLHPPGLFSQTPFFTPFPTTPLLNSLSLFVCKSTLLLYPSHHFIPSLCYICHSFSWSNFPTPFTKNTFVLLWCAMSQTERTNIISAITGLYSAPRLFQMFDKAQLIMLTKCYLIKIEVSAYKIMHWSFSFLLWTSCFTLKSSSILSFNEILNVPLKE